MDKAIVLVSGGINSTVAAAVAREQYDLCLLHVGWGHRAAEREAASFESVAGFLRVEQKLSADMSWLTSLGGNSRTSRKLAMEDAASMGAQSPSTFVQGLMPSLLSLAVMWAGGVGAKRIIVGVSEDHGVPGPAIGRVYPDYRREFVQTYNLMLDYARPKGKDLIVEAPLAELSRQEVILLGRRMKVPFEKTWSCYRGNEELCGKCLGCVTRAAGFLRAGVPDPLMLEPAGR
jgi:7-cyano-7-deazaguanine synthase